MNQNVFEIKQRAQELKEQAIAMWRNSPQSEYLEGLENDPVFSMLISAIAYQNNQTDDDIERIKEEVVNEFVRVLTPYEVGHPLPATIAIQTTLEHGYSEWDVDSNTIGWIGDKACSFMPLIRTRVLNVKMSAITRLDGRRWKVRLDFESPVKDLSRFCFAIRNSYFRDVVVTCNKFELPLVHPWQYADLPMTRCFSMDCALYNNSQYFNASTIGMELFARQNVRMYCVKEHDAKPYIQEDVESLDLIFEFTGITDKFTFDFDQLALNCMVMIEAQMNYATLSNDQPVVRLSGYNNEEKTKTAQFLHLVRPAEDQMFGDLDIQLRKASADRFNPATLTRLLSSLIDKYHSDFYAFQQVPELMNDHTMEVLQDILQNLISFSTQTQKGVVGGVYAMLSQDDLRKNRVSVDLPYLTTHGAQANDLLNNDMLISLPSGFVRAETSLIAQPVLGSDEISDKVMEQNMLRYRIVTNDRLVTPADIKLFCYTELQVRYGIDSKMVDKVSVSPQLDTTHRDLPGYEIVVEIVLKENNFVKRSIEEKISTIELLMQKMIEVRSTSVYPVRVSITTASLK